MASYLLEQTQFIPRPRSEVAAFFEDPRNLELVTPPFLKFEIDTRGEIPMKEGQLIQYTIKLNGIPMRWKSRIDEYVPGQHFVDLQLSGPYRYWHHTHTFDDVPGGTLVSDRVVFEPPMGPLGALAYHLLIRRQLNAIFGYRRGAVARILGGEPEPSEPSEGPTFRSLTSADAVPTGSSIRSALV